MTGVFVPDILAYVIRPVLAHLGPPLNSTAAEHLLLGTIAHESKGGRWLDQTTPGPGPAFGIYQMERPTCDDTIDRVTPRFPETMRRALSFMAPLPDGCAQMAGNLYWATAIARLKYWLAPPPLPSAADLDGLAAYWKRHWNTPLGKGTPQQFIAAWRDLVAPYV